MKYNTVSLCLVAVFCSFSMQCEEAPPQLGTVCVVGLGYVGLPVAVAFGQERGTIGFDISKRRVSARVGKRRWKVYACDASRAARASSTRHSMTLPSRGSTARMR